MILVLPTFHPRATAQPGEAKDPAVASPPLLCGQCPRRSLGPGEGWARPRSLWQKVPRGSISEETQCRNPNQPGGQGIGGGVGTQGLTLCSAGPLVLSMRHQLYALQPCSWFSVRVQEPRPFPLGLVQTCGLKGGLSSTERLPEVKSFFSQTNTLLIGRCVA